jgi:hypothetical protein
MGAALKFIDVGDAATSGGRGKYAAFSLPVMLLIFAGTGAFAAWAYEDVRPRLRSRVALMALFTGVALPMATAVVLLMGHAFPLGITVAVVLGVSAVAGVGAGLAFHDLP